MSDVVHATEIPYEKITPTSDNIILRLPDPVEKVGNIHLPEHFQDLARHNVMVGTLISKGPLAFTYKDGEGKLQHHEISVGDRVVFRPMAGTAVLNGKVAGMDGSYRMLSSYRDVLGTIPAAVWDAHQAEVEERRKRKAEALAMVEPVGGVPIGKQRIRFEDLK